jgi:hypothetical protein
MARRRRGLDLAWRLQYRMVAVQSHPCSFQVCGRQPQTCFYQARSRACCHSRLAATVMPIRRLWSCTTRGPLPDLIILRPVSAEMAFSSHHAPKVSTRSSAHSETTRARASSWREISIVALALRRRAQGGARSGLIVGFARQVECETGRVRDKVRSSRVECGTHYPRLAQKQEPAIVRKANISTPGN